MENVTLAENEEMYTDDLTEVLLWDQYEFIRKNLVPGTEEHARAMKTYSELYEKWINNKKINNDLDEQEKKIANEKNFKKLELIITGAGTLLGIAAPFAFNWVWMKRGFEFEKKGSYTSFTFKNAIKNYKPTKI